MIIYNQTDEIIFFLDSSSEKNLVKLKCSSAFNFVLENIDNEVQINDASKTSTIFDNKSIIYKISDTYTSHIFIQDKNIQL